MWEESKFIHPNQYHIQLTNSVGFKSYQSFICEYQPSNKTLTIHPDWNYSSTTVRHFYKWVSQYVPMLAEDINRKFFLKAEKQDMVSNGITVTASWRER